MDAAWVLNVAAAIGKRTSKARVLREEQQPRLNGLSPVLCWRSRSAALRARDCSRRLVTLHRKAVVLVAAASRVLFLSSCVRVSDNGQIVCSAPRQTAADVCMYEVAAFAFASFPGKSHSGTGQSQSYFSWCTI